MAALMKARTLKDYRLWKIQMFYVQGLWYIQAKKTRTKALGLNACHGIHAHADSTAHFIQLPKSKQ